MKKSICGLGILICLISGCLKSNNNNNTCGINNSQLIAPTNEVDSIQKYLALHSLTATEDPSGFFYRINLQGNGQSIVDLCSNVTVRYTGRLTNGFVFDSTGTGTAVFQLGQVVQGWIKGLPLITKGGKITLYIPPTLGYGNHDQLSSTGVVLIPANSVIIFDIELVDIN